MFTLGLMAIFFLVEANTTNNNVLIGCLFISYILQMFFATTSFGVCIDIGGNHAGTVSAILNSIGQTGAFFMAILFGRIVDITHNYNSPLYMITGILVAGMLVCLLINPTKKLNLDQPSKAA